MSVAEPTLGDLLKSLRDARKSVLAGMLIGLAAAGIFLFVVTPLYRGTMIIAPADGYALGDYASSVPYDEMISLPFWRPTDREGVSTDYYRLIHTLRGPSVADILLKDISVIEGVKRDFDPDEKITPEKLSEYLMKKVHIDPLGATPLRRVTYDHENREFAAAMLRKIHLVADQMIRRDRRRQSESRVMYLEKALSTTQNPDHRKGITNLLMQQEHIRMLANMDEPYAAIVVEPSFAGPKPFWPREFMVLSVAVLIGAALGYGAFVMRKTSHG